MENLKRDLLLFGCLVVVCLCAGVEGRYNYYDLDVPRVPYCGNRTLQCCLGRQDHCSVPFFGTLCYCDKFCLRDVDPDCCPDYKEVCLGIAENTTERKICSYNGANYAEGEKLRINCNECICQNMGTQMELLCEKDKCIIDPPTMDLINRENRKFGWRAANHSFFWGHKLSEGISRRLGTLHSRRKVLSMTAIKQEDIDTEVLTENFDSRTKWRGLIGPPKDQGWCGSSWVYSTVGVATDRWRLMTNGRFSGSLSYQHLLSCNSRNQRGCAGGHLSRAWAFMKKFGLVTEKCYPWTGDTSRCRLPKSKSAQDARCLEPGLEPSPQRQPLYRMGPVYRVVSEEGIMHEIMHNGPVQATMRVQPDFFMYTNGVYKCSSLPSTESGFHSVRIVGWGVEQQYDKTVKYWIVANSWGEEWGESGYFRIRKGTNECKIEEFILGAWAYLDTSRKPKPRDVLLMRTTPSGDDRFDNQIE